MNKILITGSDGYIGSVLYNFLSNKTIELNDSVFISGNDLKHQNFNSIPIETIQSYNTVIHLAGHSSVQACNENPYHDSVFNNCIDFFHLVSKLNPEQRFIYASSASVYGSTDGEFANEERSFNVPFQEYDRQKQLIDMYMEKVLINFYGLRFGTVCGYSSNPRNELLINSMVKSAIKDGKVEISSFNNYRSVLGMQDLCQAILTILMNKNAPKGFYNLASFSDTIGNIGQKVANFFNVPLIINGNTTTPYSFCLNTRKFEKTFNFKFQETVESIAECAKYNDLDKVRDWKIRL